MCLARIGTEPQPTARRPVVFVLLALILLTFSLYLPRLLTWPLRHWDEAWYAETSREILESGDWLTLRWNDQFWFHKPPLSFWATALSFECLGVSEFTARLFSSLCGTATVLIVAGFTASATGPRMGFLAGTFLLAIPEFSRFATRGQTDVPVTLWITLHLIAFWIGLDRPGLHLAGGVAFGLALMTKGAAAGLAGVVELAYMLLARDARPVRQWQWWISPVLGLLIATPWHVHQIVTHGQDFTTIYFSRHVTQFFSDIYPEVNHPPAPATYYLEFLIRKQPAWGLPALLFATAGLLTLVRRPADRIVAFAWCWTVSIPFVLSFAWAKWHWYLVPAYPGLAILAALLIDRASRRLSCLRWSPAFAAALAVFATLDVVSARGREHEHELRAIGLRLQHWLPPKSQFITLQIDSDRARSVYPVTPRFYANRNVLALHSVDEIDRAARNAGNVVFALVHADLVPEIRVRGGPSSASDLVLPRTTDNQRRAVLPPSPLASSGRPPQRITGAARQQVGSVSLDSSIQNPKSKIQNPSSPPAKTHLQAKTPNGPLPQEMQLTPAPNAGYDVEIVDQEGEIVLLRLTPGWLADQFRQAARNNAASR